MLKLVCGRLPQTGTNLASQPTISRLENAVTTRSCYRIARALVELYIRQRAKDGAPSRLLLDFDSTADPAHGEQEGAYYHGYYKERILHALLIFDGETNQLITAVLRPANAHASRGALALLKRLVERLKEEWPAVEIEIRADAGFAVPEIYDYCDKESIDYTIGLISNPRRLEALAQDLLERAKRESEAKADEKVRLVSSASYRALSWDRERRVIYKAEALKKGTNTRFVVTSRTPMSQSDSITGMCVGEKRKAG